MPKGYGADSLWNYELGIKSQWLEKRLTVNVSAFDIEWDNIQVSGRDPTGSFGFISNAGKARVTGLEFETFVHPVRGFDISAGFSYLPKRELTQDEVNNVVVAPGKAGDKLPSYTGIHRRSRAPSTPVPCPHCRIGRPGPGWTIPTTGGRPRISGPIPRPTYRIQHAYDITNFRFGATDEKTGLNLALYLDNVFDVAGEVYVLAATATPTAKYTNQPRTLGLEVTRKF